jgi:hypothetical protein
MISPNVLSEEAWRFVCRAEYLKTRKVHVIHIRSAGAASDNPTWNDN